MYLYGLSLKGCVPDRSGIEWVIDLLALIISHSTWSPQPEFEEGSVPTILYCLHNIVGLHTIYPHSCTLHAIVPLRLVGIGH